MRKRASLQEIADYFGMSRSTIYAWLRKYNKVHTEQYDPRNIQSVFDFFVYLEKHAKIAFMAVFK
jgi:DNA invertase Pin-like site-specific DNA recombinase